MRHAVPTAIVVLLMVGVGLTPMPASAQQEGDVFAKQHHALLRAADFYLEQAGNSSLPSALRVEPNSNLLVPEDGAGILGAISPARVAAARHKLLALGVDAARVFREEGVPEQLLVIAEVESAFNPNALSSKGARGLWQFMPATARRYGLQVDQHVDERLHPARSTRAAARYLRDLHLQFGDWHLVLAAYNTGEQRIARAMKRTSSRIFTDLISLLSAETRNYVPAVIGSPRQLNR